MINYLPKNWHTIKSHVHDRGINRISELRHFSRPFWYSGYATGLEPRSIMLNSLCRAINNDVTRETAISAFNTNNDQDQRRCSCRSKRPLSASKSQRHATSSRGSHSADNVELECEPMLNVMAALPNIGGALCSTPQFGWHPLLACREVTLPRRETRWNLEGAAN